MMFGPCVTVWLFAAALFNVLSCSLSQCCIQLLLSTLLSTTFGKSFFFCQALKSEDEYMHRFHYENTPIQIYGKFHLQNLKKKNQIKNSDNFHISAKYIDCEYSLDLLKPHFYTVKLEFTGVYNNFLISAQNIDCVFSLEPPCRGGSNEYPQSMFWAVIWKVAEFLSKLFQFWW